MGKVAKRIAVVLAVLVVVFFATSFAIDKHELDGTFARVAPDSPRLMPTEEFAASYDSTPVEFQFQGTTLRGYVYKAENPKGFIVFRHGITSEHADYLALICAMVDRGWTVFAYDAIGCGISDGDNVKGMAQSPLDVAAAVDYVREQGLAGDLPLVLWGHSWGGYGVAAAMDIVDDVDACVSMSGYNSPVGVLMEFTERMMGPAAVTQYPTMWLNNKLVFGADADRTALDGINKTSAPVLVIHGVGDKVVEYGGSAIIAQRGLITNPNVEYLTLDEPGRDGHNSYFYTVRANEYLAEKNAEASQLEEQYPDGLPDEMIAEFMAGFDAKRANEADPDLMNAIDGFLTEAIGGDVKATAPEQYGALQSARYTNSGNSLGNRYELEAMCAEDGSMIVCEREAVQHSMPTTVREYRADADVLEKVEAIVDAAGMKEWGELPLSEFIAYDASTPSLTLTYDSADPDDRFPVWLSVSKTYEMPDGGDALYAVRDLLLSYVTEGNLIREYEEPLR